MLNETLDQRFVDSIQPRVCKRIEGEQLRQLLLVEGYGARLRRAARLDGRGETIFELFERWDVSTVAESGLALGEARPVGRLQIHRRPFVGLLCVHANDDAIPLEFVPIVRIFLEGSAGELAFSFVDHSGKSYRAAAN